MTADEKLWYLELFSNKLAPTLILNEKVRFVDSFRIRHFFDPDFPLVGFNRKFPYIPPDEFWAPLEFRDDLTQVELLLRPWLEVVKNLRDGDNYDEAYAKAVAKLTPKNPPNIYNIPGLVLDTEEENGITIAYIDGQVYRHRIDPFFALGAHDIIDSNLPEKHVIVENLRLYRDKTFTKAHDLYEREKMFELMSNGIPKELAYVIAHDYALAHEKEVRRLAGAIYSRD